MESKIYSTIDANSNTVFNAVDDGSSELQLSVKRRLYEIFADNKSLFNESDLKNHSMNEIIDGFAQKHKNDVQKIIENVRNCLIWLKEKNYCNLNRNSFPREYYETGEAMFEHGLDLDGNVVVYMRCKNAILCSEMKEFHERLVAYTFTRAIEKGLLRKTGFIVVYDATNASTENISISMGFYYLKLLQKLSPNCLRGLLAYNISYFAKQATKAILYVMPSKIRKGVQYVNRDTITEYIAEENLPGFIRHASVEWVPSIPEASQSIDECEVQAIGIREENREKVKELFENLKKKNTSRCDKQC